MFSAVFAPFPRLPLIAEPTPVHLLKGVSEWSGHSRLFVKREDMTDTLYGGNKVRNLEFLLGDAVAKGAKRIITTAPLGSNFVAAMAAQTRRIGMPSRVFHFVPARSRQIEAHAGFSARQGTQLNLYGGGRYFGAVQASSALVLDSIRESGSYWVSPGGSNALGTLGHVRAVFELSQQIQDGLIPEPDVIVVGVGTCGTMAGLLAGIQLVGLKTRVIGVRCVDPIVCNRYRIASLANAALTQLGARARISYREVDLRDLKHLLYGEPLPGADDLIEQVKELDGTELDTTYTTKVFSFLLERIASGELLNRDVLYWNTFSPAAMTAAPYRNSHCIQAMDASLKENAMGSAHSCGY